MKEFRSFVGRVWEIFHPFHKHFAAILALLAVVEILNLVSPFLFGKILNGMQQGLSMKNAILIAGLTFCVSAAVIITEHVKAIYEVLRLDDVLDADLEDRTLRKVQGLSIGQHLSQHSGITQNVINTGRQSLFQLVQLSLFNILPIISRVMVTIFALIWFNLAIGILVFVSVSVNVGFSFFMNSLFWKRMAVWRDRGHRIGKFRSEILRNLDLVQIQAQEKRVHGEFRNRLDEYIGEGQGIWLPYMKYATGREFMIILTRFSVLIIGIFLVFRSGYKVGDFVILWAWTNQATMGISSISHLQRQWMRLSSEVRKYLALLDIKPAVVMALNPIRPAQFEGKIEFRNVSFTYQHQNYIDVGEENEAGLEISGDPALRNVSFNINPGERVAFVGESGAGKSTIINLLIRGWDPDEGQILIDGHDLRLLDLQNFRHSVGVVEQGVKLFDNTLRYNMLFGLNGRGAQVTDEELSSISRISRIDQFEHRLTSGWETWLGENGVRLSGGERQRVGIARALIKKSSILILDEATSSLDAKNERIIKDAVNEASLGRTTIIIAHRLSTVQDADRIYVMSRGSIVSEGRHNELYRDCKVYKELVESQLFAI